ncbi:MAG: type II toxin-antitoxin system ParD family antitoxin [Sphingomonadaceae bacterium]|nr:type II toxin-antitoxin system ParD family antitoxin [Sphingomonadaceae bacterium]
MAQMNLSLPDGLKAWVESRVSEGRYASASDYVRDLMRRDQERAEEIAWLQAEIDKGRASGIDPREPEQIFADAKAAYHPKKKDD